MGRLFKVVFKLVKLGCFVIIIGAVCIVILRQLDRSGSPGSHSPSPGDYSPPPVTYPAPAPPQTPNLPMVDLAIVGARGTWQQGQRYFAVTVQNYGPGVAAVVHADCSYRCAGTGTSTNSVALFRNVHLSPGRPFNQLLPVMPCPDTVFQLSCLAYAGNPVQEPNQSNNQWTGAVRF